MQNSSASIKTICSILLTGLSSGKAGPTGTLTLSVPVDMEGDAAFSAFKAATMEWTACPSRTATDCRVLSGGDITIADLVAQRAFNDREFLSSLEKRGVTFVSFRFSITDAQFPFDAVLCSAAMKMEQAA